MDRLTGGIKGFPFEQVPPQPVPKAGGATQSVQFNKVESFEQLAKALSIDARAEARFGLFGGDASMSFEESMSINSYSIFVYAVASVERGFEQVIDPKYKTEAAELLKQPGGANPFRAAYGDWFVRGMATGGQLLSLIEIRTRDEAHRKELDTQLKASYGYSFSAEGEMHSDFAEKVHSEETNVVQHQVGGTWRSIGTPEDVFPVITQFVQELGAENCTTAVPYQVGCVSYETVPVPGAPPMIDLQQAEEVLDLLAQQRKDCLRRLADLQYVLTNQDEFLWEGEHAPPETAVAALNEASRMFSQRMAKIQRAASKVAATLAPVDLVAELGDMPAWSLPARPQPKASAPAPQPPAEIPPAPPPETPPAPPTPPRVRRDHTRGGPPGGGVSVE